MTDWVVIIPRGQHISLQKYEVVKVCVNGQLTKEQAEMVVRDTYGVNPMVSLTKRYLIPRRL